MAKRYINRLSVRKKEEKRFFFYRLSWLNHRPGWKWTIMVFTGRECEKTDRTRINKIIFDDRILFFTIHFPDIFGLLRYFNRINVFFLLFFRVVQISRTYPKKHIDELNLKKFIFTVGNDRKSHWMQFDFLLHLPRRK